MVKKRNFLDVTDHSSDSSKQQKLLPSSVSRWFHSTTVFTKKECFKSLSLTDLHNKSSDVCCL